MSPSYYESYDVTPVYERVVTRRTKYKDARPADEAVLYVPATIATTTTRPRVYEYETVVYEPASSHREVVYREGDSGGSSSSSNSSAGSRVVYSSPRAKSLSPPSSYWRDSGPRLHRTEYYPSEESVNEVIDSFRDEDQRFGELLLLAYKDMPYSRLSHD